MTKLLPRDLGRVGWQRQRRESIDRRGMRRSQGPRGAGGVGAVAGMAAATAVVAVADGGGVVVVVVAAGEPSVHFRCGGAKLLQQRMDRGNSATKDPW